MRPYLASVAEARGAGLEVPGAGDLVVAAAEQDDFQEADHYEALHLERQEEA